MRNSSSPRRMPYGRRAACRPLWSHTAQLPPSMRGQSSVRRTASGTMLPQGKSHTSLPAAVCTAHPVNQRLQIERVGSFTQSACAYRPRQFSFSVIPSEIRNASSSLSAALTSANTARAGAECLTERKRTGTTAGRAERLSGVNPELQLS